MSSGYIVAALAVGLFCVCDKSSGRKMSPVWDYYFVDEDLNFVVCQPATRRYPRGSRNCKSYNYYEIIQILV